MAAKLATSNAPEFRWHHRAAAIGKKMFVWGGNEGGTNPLDGGVYDISADTWSSVKRNRLSPSCILDECNFVAIDTERVIATDFDQGAIYNLKDNSWTGIPSDSEGRLYLSSSIWTGNALIHWEGKDVKFVISSAGEMWKLP